MLAKTQNSFDSQDEFIPSQFDKKQAAEPVVIAPVLSEFSDRQKFKADEFAIPADFWATLNTDKGVAAEIERIISWYPGVDTVKIKVGTGIREDLVRIARVRKHLPNAKIRVDVNGSWSVDDAVFNIRTIYGEIAGNFLEYVEQPVATLDELKELKERLIVDVKIAGDEVLRKARDPFAINLDGAVDVLMLKVAPLGGIKRSLELAAHHKLPVVVSSALESAVGISHGLRLASQLPKLDYACGLATSELFDEDLAQLPIVNGVMSVSTPVIDDERLQRFAVGPERLEWWRNRIKEVWKLRRAA